MLVDSICGLPIARADLARDLALIRLDIVRCRGKYPEFREVLEKRERELAKVLEET